MLSRFSISTLLAGFVIGALADLRSDLTSTGVSSLLPGDNGYSQAATAFNRRFTFKPAAVTFPTSAQQVSAVVKVGAARKLKVVARSGGHSYIANGLGGKNDVLVVDMSMFRNITMDSSTNTAVIGSGNRLGDIALALNDQGRAIPHGTCPYVGIGGHSSYGGYGFTSRMWGLTLDTILSLDVVLANGTITTASSTVNSDLFWAMRGSGGSYAITTAIKVKTFPAPASSTVFSYLWDLSAADAAKGLAALQTFVETNIPKEIAFEITLGKGSAKGKVSYNLVGGWYGPANQLNGTLAPYLSQLPRPASTNLQPGSYIQSVQNLAGGPLDTDLQPDGSDTFYAKSLMTPESSPMSTQALNAFMSWLANQGFASTTNWFVQVELYGGKNSAINAVPLDNTAFGSRSSMFTIQFYASSPNFAPPYPSSGIDFVSGIVSSITSNSPSNWTYGAYANYIDDKLTDWQQRYYGSHYARLQSLKDIYDPQDMFAFPTAIEP